MKKYFNIALAAFAMLSLSIACNKDAHTPEGQNNPGEDQGLGTITITATLSDALTRVDFEPSYTDGKPTGMALTWAEGDMIRVYNHDDRTQYEDFTLVASAIGQKEGQFTGNAIAASSYDVEVINGDFNYAAQTQPSDGVTTGLKYMASASGISDYTDIEFSSFSSVLAITAKMPSTAAAAAIKSVDITANDDIFNGGRNLTITIDTPGDADSDGILHLFATLPEGNQDVDAGTSLLVHFNAPGTNHTVYTRYVEIGSDLTFTANKLNTININASASDQHAGLCSGANASDGSYAHPYLIGDGYQLQALNTLLAAKLAGTTVYAELIDDIDLSVYDNWTSIDASTRYINLQGNDYTISNLTVTSATGSGNYRYHGLFGILYGTVENLTIENADVTGGNRVAGILAGYLGASDGAANCTIDYVTIKDSEVKGNGQICGAIAGTIGQHASASFGITVSNVTISGTTVSSSNDCGGLIGTSQGASSANRTLSISDIDIIDSSVSTTGADKYVGGLIGQVVSPNTTISDVDIKGTNVDGTSKAKAVGGVFGLVSSNADIDNCTYENNGEKTAAVTGPTQHSGSTSTAGAFIGGIAGEVSGAANFDDCHVKNATVTFTNPAENTGYWKYTGGAFGYIHNAGAMIGSTTGCSVVSATVTAYHYSGGFVGYLDGGFIDKCSVTGITYSGWNYSGGFAGEMNDATITNCSAAGNTIQTANSTVGGFVGRILGNSTLEHNTCSIQVGDNQHQVGTNNGGFVGVINTATKINDCHASGNVVASGGVCGGFAGTIDGGTFPVTNCTASGDVTIAGNNAGGFIGYAKGGSFTSCSSSGTVSCAYYGGGFVGRSNAASFDGCHYDGTAVSSSGTASNAMTGGFVGQSDGVAGDSFTNCYVYNANGVTVTGHYQRSGGFVGQIGATSNHGGTYSKCYVKNVTVNGSGSNNGGFVGVQYATIEKCWVDGGTVNASGNQHGGFSGFIQAADLNDCYSTATVVGGSRNTIGGLVGVTNSGIHINRCYFAGTVSGTGSNVGYLIGSLVSGAIADKCISWSSTLPLAGNAAGTVSDCYVKTASETGTVSSHAQESPRSWSGSTWDFSGTLPTLR